MYRYIGDMIILYQIKYMANVVIFEDVTTYFTKLYLSGKKQRSFEATLSYKYYHLCYLFWILADYLVN